ncbi:MAG TPA: peptidoglycan-binding domain-containing protein [Clostridia bacterium]|nr:peptidoglycan-binding domain-containing protein [Clostridia bacterium]
MNGFYKASNKSLLRYGSRCSGVYELQSILNRKDFDCGAVDGIFGPKTLAAVKAFQAAENITVDGIVGPVTWSRLLK